VLVVNFFAKTIFFNLNPMSLTNPPKTMSKGELAQAYGVHPSTLKNWLSTVPGLELRKGQRVLTPKQVRLTMEHLGEP